MSQTSAPFAEHLAIVVARDFGRAATEAPALEDCCFPSVLYSARIQLALNGQFGASLGEPPDRSLNFAAAIHLTTGYGRSLSRYLHIAVANLEQSGSVLWNTQMIGPSERFVMTAPLLCHPRNQIEVPRWFDRPIIPRDVKRALDYMQSNLDAPITMADIVAASGVPGRTLFKHFRDWKDVSPMRHLRNMRFSRVREALLRADRGQTVTEISMDLGFTHMGRFSVEYRRRYGEHPSRILRK